MSTIHPRPRGRAGFTLIEMLVVIAIIAILVALLVAGVMGAFGKGYEAMARNDMLNLAGALQNFKKDKGFYPPSELKLHSKLSDYNQANALDVQSILYLSAMFKDIAWNTNPNAAIAWAGATPIPAAGFTLDGDQCLVFCLAGPPVGGGVLTVGNSMAILGGFSTNPTDPVYLGPYTAARKQLDRKMYYDFPANRLYLREANNPFPSYQDAWPSQGPSRPVSPYVYFCAGKSPNGYDPTQVINFSIPVKGVATNFPVSPYVQTVATATTPTVYYMSNSFQIITAGLDGKFAPGGTVTTAPLKQVAYPTLPAGSSIDDFSNFWDKQLGSY